MKIQNAKVYLILIAFYLTAPALGFLGIPKCPKGFEYDYNRVEYQAEMLDVTRDAFMEIDLSFPLGKTSRDHARFLVDEISTRSKNARSLAIQLRDKYKNLKCKISVPKEDALEPVEVTIDVNEKAASVINNADKALKLVAKVKVPAESKGKSAE